MKQLLMAVGLLVVLLVAFVLYRRATNVSDYVNPPENLEVTSSAFEDKGSIPRRYTGRGEDVSPPLQLHSIDPEAETIAVIMDDVDHPLGVYNHWLIWNIPVDSTRIPEAIPRKTVVPSLENAVQGRSHYGGKHYYRGPKPPFGTHKYVFKVYVLDTALELNPEANKRQLQKAMNGHILQFGTLTGNFGG
jgi:hypothetical protein